LFLGKRFWEYWGQTGQFGPGKRFLEVAHIDVDVDVDVDVDIVGVDQVRSWDEAGVWCPEMWKRESFWNSCLIERLV
jgi:hypothetical protein